MFWDRLSIQTKWVVFFYQMSVGIDSDLNENEKDPYQQSVQENEMGICKEILKDVDNIINFLIYLSLIFQLTHHILISIPLPSTNLFFQLTYQFNRISIPIQSTNLFFQLACQFNLISIPIPSTKDLLMYLMTIPLVLHLTIFLYVNQLIYQKTARRKNVQGHKSKNQRGMLKNTLFCNRVKNHAEKGVLPRFPVMIEPE